MSNLILPLSYAEPRYLQALIRHFKLTRIGNGSILDVIVKDNDDALWDDLGKDAARERIKDFYSKAKEHQQELDEYLINGKGVDHEFGKGGDGLSDETFCFRYGSGGTLPIIHQGGKDYYCLFYREIFPIGWNIANGGFDSRLEMLYPLLAIERELREELIIADIPKRRRFKFYWAAGRPLDRPEFGTAHLLWARKLSHIGYQNFSEKDINVEWENGPDILNVRVGHEGPESTTGCFININAIDFGIEIDRIAKIEIPDSAVLLDGEIPSHGLINAPVGLFEVERMDDMLSEDGWKEPRDFIPDYFFYTGQRFEGSMIMNKVTQEYVPSQREKLWSEKIKNFYEESHKFDLCPVTSRIIKRWLKTKGESETAITYKDGGPYDVFISYRRCEPDRSFARNLRQQLINKGFRVAFDEADFSPGETFLEEMERCIRASRYTLAIITPRYVESGNCIEEAIIRKVLDMDERKRRLIPIIMEKTILPVWFFDIVPINFTIRNPAISPLDILVSKLRKDENKNVKKN